MTILSIPAHPTVLNLETSDRIGERVNNVVSVQKPRKVGEEKKKKDLVRSDAAPSTAAHPVLGTDSVSPPNSPAATATTANSGSAPQRK